MGLVSRLTTFQCFGVHTCFSSSFQGTRLSGVKSTL